MAGTNEIGLTRDGLIWRIAEVIGRAEGKPFTSTGDEKSVTRDYLLDLIREVTQAVEGRRKL